MSYISALEITPRVIAAIKQLLRGRHWYATDLAEVLDVSPASVSKWLRRRTATIKPEIAARLLPLIEPYLAQSPTEVRSNDADYGSTPLSETAEILALIYDTLSAEAQSRIEKYIRQEEAREVRRRAPSKLS